MVATPTGVVTWLLSRWADPSLLGAHRFKIEGCAPFPPLALSFLFFPLLLPPPCSLFSSGFSACLECSWWEVTPHSCRRGETSQQQQCACQVEETGQ
ncbi:hypothetical protein Taro_055723 [Colocasia esculenta]|uniref:Uncharacterized protein n=1 Tax=Colocasia esculenta TaxID=4460 RepID=A0A843XV55_COLES|nr:hypothetical protein [Colocasia esculenta]